MVIQWRWGRAGQGGGGNSAVVVEAVCKKSTKIIVATSMRYGNCCRVFNSFGTTGFIEDHSFVTQHIVFLTSDQLQSDELENVNSS